MIKGSRRASEVLLEESVSHHWWPTSPTKFITTPAKETPSLVRQLREVNTDLAIRAYVLVNWGDARAYSSVPVFASAYGVTECTGKGKGHPDEKENKTHRRQKANFQQSGQHKQEDGIHNHGSSLAARNTLRRHRHTSGMSPPTSQGLDPRNVTAGLAPPLPAAAGIESGTALLFPPLERLAHRALRPGSHHASTIRHQGGDQLLATVAAIGEAHRDIAGTDCPARVLN